MNDSGSDGDRRPRKRSIADKAKICEFLFVFALPRTFQLIFVDLLIVLEAVIFWMFHLFSPAVRFGKAVNTIQ